MGRMSGMEMIDVAIIAAFVVGYGLVSGRIEHSLLTGPMLFVAFGLTVGSEGFGII